MSLTMPMIPVYMEINFIEYRREESYQGKRFYYKRRNGRQDEIPLPDCEIVVSINGNPYTFRQSRCWHEDSMWVTLIPVGYPNDIPRKLKEDVRKDSSWEPA